MSKMVNIVNDFWYLVKMIKILCSSEFGSSDFVQISACGKIILDFQC